MATFEDRLVGALKNTTCTLLRFNDQWAKWVDSLGYDDPYGPINRALSRWLCNDDEDPNPPPPFTGGQCPGVWYNISFVNDRTGQTVRPASLPGPIHGYSTYSNQWHWRLRVVYGNNSIYEFVYDSVTYGTVTVSGFAAVRQDGQPDTCGNPLPVLPPLAPINVDVDVTYGDNNEFNVSLPFVFAPLYVALDGSINAPVTVELFPGLTVNGNVEFFPNFRLNLGLGGQPGNRDPFGPPPPMPPTGGGAGDDTPPDEPPVEDSPFPVFGLFLSGVAQPDTPSTAIFQSEGPDIFAPRLGTVRFATHIGTGEWFWSEDIPIKGLQSFIQCPIPWGALRYSVNPVPGVALNIVPYYSQRPEWPKFLELGNARLRDNR